MVLRRIRPLIAGGILVLVTTAAAVPARAGEDLAKDIEQALGHVEEERWERGIEAIQALFVEHEGSAALRAELPRLEDALQVCLFRNGRRMPSGEDLFGKNVKRFQHGSRVLHLKGNGLRGDQWRSLGDGLRLLLPIFDGHVSMTLTTEIADLSAGRLLFFVTC